VGVLTRNRDSARPRPPRRLLPGREAVRAAIWTAVIWLVIILVIYGLFVGIFVLTHLPHSTS